MTPRRNIPAMRAALDRCAADIACYRRHAGEGATLSGMLLTCRWRHEDVPGRQGRRVWDETGVDLGVWRAGDLWDAVNVVES